jgi:acrylyl-CoA reductase (NADPH)
MTFQAILLERGDTGVSAPGFNAHLAALDESMLPEGDVLLDVSHSTLNYKDALALTNASPVVRRWPMVPGVDGAGTVLESTSPRWQAGDRVILNGWGVGETHWGCLATRARLKGEWLVALPPGLTPAQAMAVGTAGYTAALCLLAIERHGVQAGDGEILVTGATGGVGSVAIALAAAAGYRVVAATGKAQEAAYLQALGAAEVIERAELAAPGKPLQRERWAAVIDTAGSHTLANACAQTRYHGIVAACGLAQGMDFPASVAPFILRGVTLAGIDSVMAPLALREAAWRKIDQHLERGKLAALTQQIGLADTFAAAAEIMAGRVRGRYVVDVRA